jgi:perosamine synthetase
MTNLSAAIGTAQAARWDELVAGRAEVARLYDAQLAEHSLSPRPKKPWASPSCWLYCVTSPERDSVVERARLNGVDARAVWPALCDLPLYRRYTPRPCIHASRISRTAMWLPTWSHMPPEDVAAVAESIL